MKSPVLIIAFNRPETTAKVFDAVKKAKPPKLFISCDAPREGNTDDEIKCQKVREIFTKIDWACEVFTLYQEKNLGCSLAPSKAISWFFKKVEQGIILEDDCLPSNSFFSFCDEMLEKYAQNEKIMMISGNKFNTNRVGDADYYFSHVPITWGWASWRRAWDKFDLEMKKYPEFRENHNFKKIYKNPNIRWYWTKILDRVQKGEITTAWDYQWFFAIWSSLGFAITPNINLVQNIGFDGSGTHTDFDAQTYSVETKNFVGPLIHPSAIELTSPSADEDRFRAFYKVDISLWKASLRRIFDKKFRSTVG